MNLMEAISSGNGAPVSAMAKKFGLSEADVKKVIRQMVPALTNGVKKNVSEKGGLEGLVNALYKGDHDQYLDNPGALKSSAAVDDGNGILGHVLRSKETSRELAARLSGKTGVSADILKQMLPLIAGLVMGALKKQGSGSGGFLGQLLESLTGAGSAPSSSSGGLLESILGGGKKSPASSALESLTGLLDADGKSSPIDDLLGMTKGLF